MVSHVAKRLQVSRPPDVACVHNLRHHTHHPADLHHIILLGLSIHAWGQGFIVDAVLIAVNTAGVSFYITVIEISVHYKDSLFQTLWSTILRGLGRTFVVPLTYLFRAGSFLWTSVRSSVSQLIHIVTSYAGKPGSRVSQSDAEVRGGLDGSTGDSETRSR